MAAWIIWSSPHSSQPVSVWPVALLRCWAIKAGRLDHPLSFPQYFYGFIISPHPGPAWTTAIIKQYVAVWMERGLNTAPNPSTQFMFYLESNFNMKAMYNVELVEQCRSVLIFKNRERPVWLRVFTCRLKLHFPVWKVRSNIFTFSFKFSLKFSCNLHSIWEEWV